MTKPKSAFLGSLGRRIAFIRDRKGLTQAELSKKSGVNRSHLCEIEVGQTDARIETLRLISTALGMKVSDLLLGLE